ncbi:MAG: hypothetical protein JXA78_19330 [Anaerolineales bacterium]|nr:hypothetical protein [Anaerolineales bacterium]
MSLQFSRSLRSLRADSFQAARIGMLLAIVNLLVLIAWFFLAKVTLYEISSSLSFAKNGRVIAEFPKQAIARIRSGQSAVLRLETGADQPSLTLPALVYGVERNGTQVELLIMAPDLPPEALAEGLSGQVQVEVEHITPAELVLRASGTYLGGSQIPISPQSFEDDER